jgi:hypothetical protein
MFRSLVPHQCPPRWLVWDPDDSDEEHAIQFYGAEPEDAVEQWAEEADSNGDYSIVNGATVTVLVRMVGSSEPARRFKVTGECEPSYTATEERIPDAPP